jgi:hypothetical protein
MRLRDHARAATGLVIALGVVTSTGCSRSRFARWPERACQPGALPAPLDDLPLRHVAVIARQDRDKQEAPMAGVTLVVEGGGVDPSTMRDALRCHARNARSAGSAAANDPFVYVGAGADLHVTPSGDLLHVAILSPDPKIAAALIGRGRALGHERFVAAVRESTALFHAR